MLTLLIELMLLAIKSDMLSSVKFDDIIRRLAEKKARRKVLI